MITVNTPLDAFLKWLEQTQSLTFGQDLFTEAPSTNEIEDPITWVLMRGGDKQVTYLTGEAHQIYGFDIYHRDLSGNSAQQFAFKLTNDLTCNGCFQLEKFETIDITASSSPVDSDIDSEDRRVILVQATAILSQLCST